MVSQNNGSIAKEILKNLCCNNGWSYGVFWSYNQQNPLLLTLQDEYHEDQTRFFIDDMLLQVHMLGEGVIGTAASTMKHQFFFSDAQINTQNSIGFVEGFEAFQDNFEIFSQFLSGIKTISVIPLEQLGVVQFGSFQKLSETMEFVDQTEALFSEIRNGGLIPREDNSLSSSSEILIPGGVFSSLLSSDNPSSATCGYSHAPCEEPPMETTLPLTNLIWPSTSPSFDDRIEDMNNQLIFDDCHSNIMSQQFFLPSGNFQDGKNSLFCNDDWFDNMESDLWMSSSDAKLHGLTGPHFHGDIFQEIDVINELPQLLSTKPDQYNKLLTETRKVIECNPSTSTESSISNIFTTVGNNKRSTMSGIGNLLRYPGEDSGCSRPEQFGNSISSGHVENSGIGSKCILRPTNKLFSSLGINKLLHDVSSSSCSVSKSSIEDQLSSANKRRRTYTPLRRNNEERLSTLASSGGEMNIFHSIYNSNTMSKAGSERDVIHRPLSDSSVCDSFSIHGGKVLQCKEAEQPAKNPKKKSKPGIRPRPKDRQQIADRLLELRNIIPNAEKMSIDCLLHRTIKHLVFLQSVSEHAESIKQPTDPKDRILPRDITSTHDNGVTWACEVGDQTMVCPLIVEDLNTHGQMSIEIQCEELDSFLEIVDIIRGFGLAILKGVMETQKSKMCARFTVATEGKNHVRRHEVFASLVQLLQFTSSTGVSSTDQFNTCQQSAIQLPV